MICIKKKKSFWVLFAKQTMEGPEVSHFTEGWSHSPNMTLLVSPYLLCVSPSLLCVQSCGSYKHPPLVYKARNPPQTLQPNDPVRLLIYP